MKRKVGLAGARGYVGREIVRLLAAHPGFELAWVTSSKEAGKPAQETIAEAPNDLLFEAPDPIRLAKTDVDVVIFGLPNGESDPWVRAFDAKSTQPSRTVLIDLSTDHRGAHGWVYGQPERHRAQIGEATRIANPGCYATAMQLALDPLVAMIEGPAHVFGVSGYSGAGATPSPRNDPETLRDNLMPYQHLAHSHETEVARELGHDIAFTPHVASFFRGLMVTCSFALREAQTSESLAAAFHARYRGEPMITLLDASPLVKDSVGKHDVRIGGWTVSPDGRRGAVVATLDNLLGGAASQALRNANLATGQAENTGLS